MDRTNAIEAMASILAANPGARDYLEGLADALTARKEADNA